MDTAVRNRLSLHRHTRILSRNSTLLELIEKDCVTVRIKDLAAVYKNVQSAGAEKVFMIHCFPFAPTLIVFYSLLLYE